GVFMNSALFGYFIGAFASSLFMAAVWLIIAKIIPPLRSRPKITYFPAMALALLAQLLTISGPTAINFSAAALCIAVLFWQFKRAQSKLEECNASSESK
ncbi:MULTISPECIES: hypothetical protein, partial [unclassified Aeromonas]|uniref:hypothetical protein n=2 Tax=Aeromonadaceae TaxID=84642 RepID=UPI0022E43B23